MNRTLCLVLGLVLAMVLCAAPASADMLTLKQLNATGYTYSDTSDVQIEWSSTAREYNQGVSGTLGIGSGATATSYYRVSLLKFDLASLSGITSVDSATLRVYQTAGPNQTKRVWQMTQSWVEGASTGAYGDPLSGANCYAYTAGNFVSRTDFQTYDHSGTTLYYIDAADLAVDPVDGIGHYIARSGASTNTSPISGYDIVNNKLTSRASLDDLAATTAGSYNYYYDSAAGRLYLRFNTRNVQWYSEDDMWPDSIWDGSETKGPRSSSYSEDYVSSTVNTSLGWNEWDVTAMVNDWLDGTLANNGWMVSSATSYTSITLASSDALMFDPVSGKFSNQTGYDPANAIYVQPELVVQYTAVPTPEPATVAMLAIGGVSLLGLRLRRRRLMA